MNRSSIRLAEARLYDSNLKELVGHNLLWEGDDPGTLARETIIESGMQKRLYVFAKDRYADEFFVYYSDHLAADPPRSPARYSTKGGSSRLSLEM